MKFDKLFNKSKAVLVSLVILSLFVGLSCAAAADVNTADQAAPHNNILKMTVKINEGNGYHWEVDPSTHGVTFMFKNKHVKNPGTFGSSALEVYTFLKQSKDYYVKLNYISPTGEIVKSVESGR